MSTVALARCRGGDQQQGRRARSSLDAGTFSRSPLSKPVLLCVPFSPPELTNSRLRHLSLPREVSQTMQFVNTPLY